MNGNTSMLSWPFLSRNTCIEPYRNAARIGSAQTPSGCTHLDGGLPRSALPAFAQWKKENGFPRIGLTRRKTPHVILSCHRCSSRLRPIDAPYLLPSHSSTAVQLNLEGVLDIKANDGQRATTWTLLRGDSAYSSWSSNLYGIVHIDLLLTS